MDLWLLNIFKCCPSFLVVIPTGHMGLLPNDKNAPGLIE
jgi:hypothetical protein